MFEFTCGPADPCPAGHCCDGESICVLGDGVEAGACVAGGPGRSEGEGEGPAEGEGVGPGEGEGEGPAEGEGEGPAEGEGEGPAEGEGEGEAPCQGAVLEHFDGPPLHEGDDCEGQGRCQIGVVECDERTGKLVCSSFPGGSDNQAVKERCGVTDDDCDGQIDEFLGVGDECEAGIGQCAQRGELFCGDAEEPLCDAEAGDPGVEICSGLDEDCDEIADNVVALLVVSDRLNDPEYAASHTSLVFNGGGYGLMWLQSFEDGLPDIMFRRLTIEGEPLTAPIRVVTGGLGIDDRTAPALVRADEGYGMVWQESRGRSDVIRFHRLSAIGRPVGAYKLIGEGRGRDPALVWTGTGFGVAWVAGEAEEVWFDLLTSSGEKLGPSQLVGGPGGEGQVGRPRIAWTGDRFAVVWAEGLPDDMTMQIAMVPGDGGPVERRVTLANLGGPPVATALAWSGAGLGVV